MSFLSVRTRDGEIWLTLRHRWADGTTHLRFDPLGVDVLACPRCGGRLRLVALIEQTSGDPAHLATPRASHRCSRAARRPATALRR